MPAIPIESLRQFVVAETIRQIRNGQVDLAAKGINCDPDLKVDFTVTVIIKGGLNALQRSSTQVQDNTQTQGERLSTQKTASTGTQEEKSTGKDSQSQGYGRNNTTQLFYEED